MKKYISLLLFGLGIFSYSCDQREIICFDDKPEIYFDKFYMNAVFPGTEQADSTVTSFFFYPDGTKDINVPLSISLSGKKLTSDLYFGLKVVPEGTTANADEYTIAASYVFRNKPLTYDMKEIKDTVLITMHYSDRLANRPEGVRLMVEIVPNELMGTGQIERTRSIIILSTNVIKPDWWTSDVEANLLGAFSEKKYKLFLNEIDKEAQMGEDLIKNRQDLAIKLVLQFKIWLSEQETAIYEEDGSLMEVNV